MTSQETLLTMLASVSLKACLLEAEHQELTGRSHDATTATAWRWMVVPAPASPISAGPTSGMD